MDDTTAIAIGLQPELYLDSGLKAYKRIRNKFQGIHDLYYFAEFNF